MPLNNSRTGDRNDVLLEVDDYGAPKTANAASGIGGTTSAGETLDRVGSAASEFNDAAAARGGGALNDNMGGALGELDNIEMNDASPLKWIMPLVILALLVAFGSWFCGKS